MRKWEYFDVEDRRSESVAIYGESQRAELEALVASQVSDILSRFGTLRKEQVDETGIAEADESKTFTILQFGRILFEDDSELLITQLPVCDEMTITVPGHYRLLHEDEDGETIRDYIVYDPELEVKTTIHDTDNVQVNIDILQELYEILAILLLNSTRLSDVENIPPLKAWLFPMPISEPDFECIIARLQ
jgi:hypothetical protein